MKKDLRPLLLSALLAAACSEPAAAPRDQWKIVLQTDASIPQFGDRLLLRVLDQQGELACSACERLLPAGEPEAWPMSFGAVARDEPTLLYARLYRAVDAGPEGLPSNDIGIAILGQLPPSQGVTEVLVTLSMDCFGHAVDLETKRSCSPASGEQVLSLELDAASPKTARIAPGSWPPAQSIPCSGDVPQDMICVPGGLFLLGTPTSPYYGPTLDPRPERLVRLSPFALDSDEITVEELRQLQQEGLVLPSDITQPSSRCTDTGDAESAAMPANCLSFTAAEAICQFQGKRLPTEAEWEFAAGNREREDAFPWGSDGEGICERAVVSRGELLENAECRSTADEEIVPAGPSPGGTLGDVTELGLRNMVGNLSEWVKDRFAPYSAPCWSEGAPKPLEDPVCETGTGQRSIRGNDWWSPLSTSQIHLRDEYYARASDRIGVRCAYPPVP
jgi:formylglycine-generating enzyme